MVAIPFEDLLEAVKALDAPHKAVVLHVLQQKPDEDREITREMIIAEHEARCAAGAFKNAESLRNVYKGGKTTSYEELEAIIHEAATEWEQELDEFYNKPD